MTSEPDVVSPQKEYTFSQRELKLNQFNGQGGYKPRFNNLQTSGNGGLTTPQSYIRKEMEDEM